MILKKGNYPYPAENVFLVLGGPNENYVLANPLSIKTELDQSELIKNVNVLNKIVSFVAVSKNKILVEDYAKDIMPEWWATYNIISLSEIQKWVEIKEKIFLGNGEEWLVNLSVPPYSLILEGSELDFHKIKHIIDNNMNEESFVSAIPMNFVQQTIIDMDAIRKGSEQERFVFDLENNELNDYIDNLFLNLPKKQQNEIIQNSKK